MFPAELRTGGLTFSLSALRLAVSRIHVEQRPFPQNSGTENSIPKWRTGEVYIDTLSLFDSKGLRAEKEQSQIY